MGLSVTLFILGPAKCHVCTVTFRPSERTTLRVDPVGMSCLKSDNFIILFLVRRRIINICSVKRRAGVNRN